MKKLFFAFAAIATLASCNNDQIIDFDKNTISFGEAFVDNATKALYDDANHVKKFMVWGNVKGTNTTPVAIYNGDTVEDESGTYGTKIWNQTSGTIQYWIPNCTYNFYAIVDAKKVDATNGAPTKIHYTTNANGDNDLLYGAVTNVKTNENSVPSGTGIATISSTPVVSFTLGHLLSKIQFKFTNGSGAYSYNVKDITVEGVKINGEYTISDGEWAYASDAGSATLSFGNVAETIANAENASAAKACVIVPGAQTLTLKFNAEVVIGEPISTIPFTKTLTHTFEKNTSYVVNVILPAPGQEIQFSISGVPGFTPNNDDVDLEL